MIFNKHLDIDGMHAFLGASKYHWLNYDDEKIVQSYYNRVIAAQRGTQLHNFAKECILLNQKLPRSNKTLNQYVNDAIGYGMTPEQPLVYSQNSFGTADTISFKNGLLRIHDLKTGTIPAHIEQLNIYAALFCLEYDKKPSKINMELRIYQNDDIFVSNPDSEEIGMIMTKIIHFDKIIDEAKSREDW